MLPFSVAVAIGCLAFALSAVSLSLLSVGLYNFLVIKECDNILQRWRQERTFGAQIPPATMRGF
jgi:hypothetical protein